MPFDWISMRNLGRLFFATRGTFRNHYCHAKNFHKLFRLSSRMPSPPPASPRPPFSTRSIKTNNWESGCFPLEMSVVSRKQVFRERRDNIGNCEKSSPTQRLSRSHQFRPRVGKKTKISFVRWNLQRRLRGQGLHDVVAAIQVTNHSPKAINTNFNTKGLRGKFDRFRMFSFLSPATRSQCQVEAWNQKRKLKVIIFIFLRIFVVGWVGEVCQFVGIDLKKECLRSTIVKGFEPRKISNFFYLQIFWRKFNIYFEVTQLIKYNLTCRVVFY